MNLIHVNYNFSEIDTYLLSLYDAFNQFLKINLFRSKWI